MLVSYATGGSGDNVEYKNLRRELQTKPPHHKDAPPLCSCLPRPFGVLEFIKPKFATYAERREYLRNEFDC